MPARIGQGTYSGVYSGGDYGTVTIVVDAQGNATCDFFQFAQFLSIIKLLDGDHRFFVGCQLRDAERRHLPLVRQQQSEQRTGQCHHRLLGRRYE